MSDVFMDGMIKLSMVYVNKFEAAPEETLQMLCNTEVPIQVMESVYRYLVNTKEIKPIEELDIEIKNKLWQQSCSTCPGGTKEKQIQLSKSIWVINSVLEK